MSFAQVLSTASRGARAQVNKRGSLPQRKSVRAALSQGAPQDEVAAPEFWRRCLRRLLGLALLPVCWVTTWTFLSRFSQSAVQLHFWQTAEFWYFAVGVLLMLGWFWSGLLQEFFLYLYVLGHELTHAVFVFLHRGKVTDFYVSTSGGYITTNKTNLLIALSPYFVPLWSIAVVIAHFLLRLWLGPSQQMDRLLYAAVGLTWTFHFVWTLWMIPRDQPDLKENGTFLSLIVIYLGNLAVLIALLCLAGSSPWQAAGDFGVEWLEHTVVWLDAFWHWLSVNFLR